MRFRAIALVLIIIKLLDSLDAVYGYAKLIEKGVKLSKETMLALNEGFERLKGLAQPQCPPRSG